MSNLYALTTEVLDLMNSEESTDEQLQAAFGNVAEKAVNCAQYHSVLTGQVELFDKEIKRLTERKKALSNQLDRFKEYLKLNMERLEIDKLEAGTFTITLANNPESVEVTDESAIPPKYVLTTTTHTIDKNAVKAALKSGELVNGASLKRGKSIRIR